MNIKFVSTLCASAALFSGAALAGDHMSASEKFSALDANADGVISQEEFVSSKTADGKMAETDAVEAFDEAAGDDAELTAEEFEIAWAEWDKKKSGNSGE